MTTAETCPADNGAPGPDLLEGPVERSARSKVVSLRVLDNEQVSQAEINDISRGIISTYSRLDAHLKLRRGLIVDAYGVLPRDLALITPMTRKEALENFRNLESKVESIGLDNLQPEWRLIYGNLLATSTFLEEEERLRRGLGKTDYDQYLMKTSGIRPALRDWQELDESLSNVIEHLKGLGLKFRSNSVPSVLGAYFAYIENFRKYHYPEEVTDRFWDHFNRFRPDYAATVGRDLSKLDFRVVWGKADSFWMFWERPNVTENILYANWHRRHRNHWYEGRIEMYAYHEPAHFVYVDSIRDEIRNGNLDPAVGIIPIPSPACFQLEGLAQTVPDFIDLDLSVDGKVAAEVYRLDKAAVANSLYVLERDVPEATGEKLERAIDDQEKEIRKYMLFNTPPETRQLLKEGFEKPLERAYFPTYSQADKFYRGVSREARADQRLVIYRDGHRSPRTPIDLAESAQQLLAA
ncbi:MAG TPA: hypothetical protein VJ065_02450 [Patescibacteria group bacterium]|nr:hypothetical protein [Patescibacteria group bacterium]